MRILRRVRRIRCSRGRGWFAVAPPQESLLARAPTREITAAKLTSIGSGPKPQRQQGSGRRVVVLLRPGAQFHAIAPRAAGIDHVARLPDGSLITQAAVAAAELINADKLPDALFERTRFRNPDISRTARWTNPVSRHGTLVRELTAILTRLCGDSNRNYPIAPAGVPFSSCSGARQ
jgi:hypothetical protein